MEMKTYVKMCDCKEIQEQWKLKKGDCFSFVGDIHILADYEIDALNERKTDTDCYNDVVKLMGGHFVDHWNECRDGFTWLPRQDDIQKMFKEEAFVLAGKFSDEMENYITGDPSWWTMQGLWLAYYMWKKHGKIWGGEEWVEEKKEE